MAVVIFSVGAVPEIIRVLRSILVLRPGPGIVIVNSGGGDIKAPPRELSAGIIVIDSDRLL